MNLLEKLGIGGIDSKYVMMIESLTKDNIKGKGIHPYSEKLNPAKEEKKFDKTKEYKLNNGDIKWAHYFYDKNFNEYFYA